MARPSLTESEIRELGQFLMGNSSLKSAIEKFIDFKVGELNASTADAMRADPGIPSYALGVKYAAKAEQVKEFMGELTRFARS